jgi:hypothetical protein
MATTTPARAAQENSLITTVISVAALVAVVLLVYFMARGKMPGSQSNVPAVPTALATP